MQKKGRPGAEEQKSIDKEFLNAVEKADPEAAEKALDQGADIEAKDNTGQTALIAASRNGNEEMVRLLIGKGADVNASMKMIEDPRWNWDNDLPSPDTKYQGVVQFAIEASYQLDEGKDNPLDTNGKTALIEAASRGHKGIIALLVGNGADVNAKTEKGKWTALMSAALEGHFEIAKLLLEYGADASAKNYAGFSALHWAEKKGNREIADLLRRHGTKEKEESSNSFSNR